MNLLNAFKDLAGDQIAELAGNYIGASKDDASSAMSSIMPALLGGLMGKAKDESAAQGVLDFLGNNDLGGGMLENLGGLFGSQEKTSGLLGMGGTVLNFLMGNRTNAVIDMLTKVTGLDNTKMGSMLKIAAPLLMSFIGKKVKSDGLGAKGLFSLLSSQKDYMKDAAPAGLLGSLGLSGWGDQISRVADNVGDGVRGTADAAGRVAANVGDGVRGAADATGRLASNTAAAGKSGIQKLLPWLGLVLVALAALWFLRGCNGDEIKNVANDAMDKTGEMAKKTGNAIGDAATATGDAIGDAANATGEAIGDAGKAVANAFKSVKLPSGQEIKFGAESMMADLNDYLTGDKVDANRRFTFDGVNFKTGSAQLTAESSAQLNNLVAVMKAYKGTAIRVEGHTDNTGDAGKNLTLSNQRALAVKKYLMDAGIAGNRVASKGMGQTKPVASNDTDEGRAQNRRVDVYVTKK